ncbi:DNA fragmentation factor subunit beta-like [Pollicipes pollicipes]|nr:DNA fragmentation factor subunit beta-like [Pollicipes pollicipes]XP_037069352.1 DNA fragmentation factor subunit beta-like [Pollicipes pollicipes]
MLDRLRADRFHGHRFDRGHAGRLCDAAGTFACQGEFAAERCGYDDHRVNPYSSREQRIVFSTWNLDHRIERSRTILPTLVETAQSAGPHRRVNSDYFYRLLFTTENLRLVHVVCHDKGSHDRFTCDPKLVYVR